MLGLRTLSRALSLLARVEVLAEAVGVEGGVAGGSIAQWLREEALQQREQATATTTAQGFTAKQLRTRRSGRARRELEV